MQKVTIYTTSYCPYCVRAKALLTKKAIAYQEIDVEHDEQLRQDMTKRAGGKRTVPQIFIGDYHVGGCDDLYALESKKELDELLG